MAEGRRGSQKRPGKRWATSRILTWLGLGCLAAAIVVLSFFAFTRDGDESRRSARQTPVVTEEQQVSVGVVDNDFEPRELTVRTGTRVTWEFKGGAAHDVTELDGAFGSGTSERGDEYSMTFDKPGTYYYLCTLHHVMQGSVVVQP